MPAVAPASAQTTTLRSRRTGGTTPRKSSASIHSAPAPSPTARPHRPQNTPTTTSGSVWSGVGTQWGSLQSIASSVLGNDLSSTAKKPSSWLSVLTESMTLDPPPTTSTSGSGRGDIYPRARRRDPPGTLDRPPPSVHRLKLVDTSPPASPTHSQQQGEQQTLVYIHPVTSTTTTEGVVIAFDTTAAAVCRANGLWPGDSVQRCKELLIPVDLCCVKGVPLDEPTGKGKGKGKGSAASSDTDDDLLVHSRHFTYPPPTPPTEPADDTAPYRPVRRVLLPGIGPTTIARLQRKKLSHFPPPRTQHSSLAPLTDPDSGALLPDASPVPVALSGRTPGVSSLHPERDDAVPGGPEFVQSVATGVGAVEKWVRGWGQKVKEGGEEVFEMVAQIGVDEEELEWKERRRKREVQRSGGGGGSVSAREGASGRNRKRGGKGAAETLLLLEDDGKDV